MPRNCFTIWCSMGPRQMMGLSPGLRNPTEMTFSPKASMGSMRFSADHFRLAVHAQHQRNVGAIDVGIEQADFVTHLGQGDGQIHRERGLTDASLAGTYGDDGIDTGKRLRPGGGLSGLMRHMCVQGDHSRMKSEWFEKSIIQGLHGDHASPAIAGGEECRIRRSRRHGRKAKKSSNGRRNNRARCLRIID